MKHSIIGCTLILLAGCSSFSTTAIDRTEDDTIVVNPTKPIKGIPVAIRVPTHLELSIIETTYWEKKTSPKTKPSLERLDTCRATRTVLHNIKETEKIFVVDPMKPGAGTQSYGFEFQSNGTDAEESSQGKGYLKNVKYKIDDTTITESAKLLRTVMDTIPSALLTGANDVDQNTSDLISTDCTVAFQRFDINSPSFEYDVAEFLDTHLNCCPKRTCPDVCKNNRCPK
ncbi:hypothetical protein V6x_52440 [Gimesia chilikensis]|uniref:Lipoprotein n=1 Tax=Gimesia chilikensis TaxID=2605989 RepID=A0A517WJT0_9PLAN|nr:hypothetical protein [Gimesia chilikensis]QDU05507.1 hypothetical protein V6x_52440 [Gimesia chilikensis]